MTIIKTVNFQLKVVSIPDFALTLPFISGQAYAGQTFPIGAEVMSIDQFAGEIVFSVSGVPAGTQVQFLPSNKVTIAPGQPRGVQINLQIPADNALVGDYTIVVRAESTAYNGV